MSYVPKTLSSGYVTFPMSGNQFLFVTATGEVNTSGWSNARLAPRFYTQEPATGVWDFDFFADAPTGPVLNLNLPLTAEVVIGAPAWLRGVRIHDASNPAAPTDAPL